MANRFYSPNQQFCDATGAPYAGGSLAFYASGTSTPLATYSDSALTQPNTNPVVLDSAGRAGNIFLQNLAYKVVLSDVNSNPIWTDDPVYTSDYSARAKLLSGAGSPNGNTAGTAGSASIGADTYWDTINNILYVCTQTGTASTAVWTAINAGAATSIIPVPQGYLTPVSGTPVITSDSIAATSVYYTPYKGVLIPVYNGSSFNPTTFSELSLTLNASHAGSTLYDVFVFNNNGVLTLVTGPAWAVSTANSGARGTGAGTTQLSRLQGLWVNTVSMTGRNGSTTYTIPANQATYVGSLSMDSSAGQVTCHRSFGQSRKWGIWNAYNRVPTSLLVGDTTASWNNAGGVRASNNNPANSATVFSGLAEETYYVRFSQQVSLATTGTSTSGQTIGIGYNSTSAFSGKTGRALLANATSSNSAFSLYAELEAPPSIGINVVTCLESTQNNNASSAYNGGQSEMQLAANWQV